MDERLARHYGIPDIHGSYFRRIALDPDSPRRGLLGQGSMLTRDVGRRRGPRRCRAASGFSKTFWARRRRCRRLASRRIWKRIRREVKATSLRQRLEAHRANPVCASCHKIMDPIGFALENFDLVGTWRERDGGTPIDSSGQLVDGTPLHGPADLRQALL